MSELVKQQIRPRLLRQNVKKGVKQFYPHNLLVRKELFAHFYDTVLTIGNTRKFLNQGTRETGGILDLKPKNSIYPR